jgi:hypothetical protein
MATKKITQNELEEMIREMVTKMVSEMPGEAPIMEKHLTPAEQKKKEELVMALKKKYGKTPKTYAIATAQAKKLAEDDINEEKVKFTSKYDDSPKLKGKQDKLPDHLQKAIIGSDDEGVEEANMSSSWQRSTAGRSYKRRTGKKTGLHYLEEEKIAELEEKKRAIIKQLEELDFGGPAVAEPDTDTEEEVITTTPPRPGRPNPFRREDDDTQVIPDLEPQGSLKDVIRRYLQSK